jgi:hypothetical protein
MLNVIMLNVVMLNGVMLSVLAPYFEHRNMLSHPTEVTLLNQQILFNSQKLFLIFQS